MSRSSPTFRQPQPRGPNFLDPNFGADPGIPRPSSRSNQSGQFFGSQASGAFSSSARSEANSYKTSSRHNESQEQSNEVTVKDSTINFSTFFGSQTEFSLTDCTLALDEQTLMLTIKWQFGDRQGECTVELDKFIRSFAGRLYWGGQGYKFFDACNSPYIEGTVFKAIYSRPGETIQYPPAELDLKDHITWTISEGENGQFVAIAPYDGLTMLMAEDWLDLTLVTRPRMSALFQNQAFQQAILDVSSRAAEQVMSEMQSAMQSAMETLLKVAMQNMRAKFDSRVKSEMKKLTANAIDGEAAFSAVANLQLMMLEQRQAYHTFNYSLSSQGGFGGRAAEAEAAFAVGGQGPGGGGPPIPALRMQYAELASGGGRRA
ncbi:hypothetical protein K438DRAFT_1986726 [Mycena galopus ATCC 62051]|nr:hypothetical protein K438DRAFT_1986726 [Mycena galopus ATCC 62051]